MRQFPTSTHATGLIFIITFLVCQLTNSIHQLLALLLCPLTLNTPLSPYDRDFFNECPAQAERTTVLRSKGGTRLAWNGSISDSQTTLVPFRWCANGIVSQASAVPHLGGRVHVVPFFLVESPQFLAQYRTLRVNDEVPPSFRPRSVLVNKMPRRHEATKRLRR